MRRTLASFVIVIGFGATAFAQSADQALQGIQNPVENPTYVSRIQDEATGNYRNVSCDPGLGALSERSGSVTHDIVGGPNTAFCTEEERKALAEEQAEQMLRLRYENEWLRDERSRARQKFNGAAGVYSNADTFAPESSVDVRDYILGNEAIYFRAGSDVSERAALAAIGTRFRGAYGNGNGAGGSGQLPPGYVMTQDGGVQFHTLEEADALLGHAMSAVDRAIGGSTKDAAMAAMQINFARQMSDRMTRATINRVTPVPAQPQAARPVQPSFSLDAPVR